MYIPKKVCLVLEKKCVKKTIILRMRCYCQPQRPCMLPFEAKKAVNRWDCNEEALCNQGFNKVDRHRRLRTDPIRQPLMRLPASSVRLHSISAV